MKIRIKDNTLRLRLTQSEVAQFETEGKVESQICFGPEAKDCLKYRLESFEGTELNAAYQPGAIVVKVPRSTGSHWAGTEQVGMQANVELGNDQELFLLIEKDFQCMKARAGEDDSDNYPNPEA